MYRRLMCALDIDQLQTGEPRLRKRAAAWVSDEQRIRLEAMKPAIGLLAQIDAWVTH